MKLDITLENETMERVLELEMTYRKIRTMDAAHPQLIDERRRAMAVAIMIADAIVVTVRETLEDHWL